jgi:hypothetical protein
VACSSGDVATSAGGMVTSASSLPHCGQNRVEAVTGFPQRGQVIRPELYRSPALRAGSS